MTNDEQACQSGLSFEPTWKEKDWPLEGWLHASVDLDHPDKDNNKGQTVIVLAGIRDDGWPTNSVHGLNLTEPRKEWRNGPPMNMTLTDHTAMVCIG